MKNAGTIFVVLAMLVSGAPDAGACEVIVGPYLLDMQPTSVTICWESATKCSYELRYGAQELDRSWQESNAVFFRCTELTDLEPGTTYTYRLLSGPYKYPDGAFRTPALDEETTRFAVYGDTRTDHGFHRQAVGVLHRMQPDFVLHTGDWVDDGDVQEEWYTFFQVVASLFARVPVVPVIGNHDNRTGTFYDQYFPMAVDDGGEPRRYYVYDRAGIRFLVLSTEEPYAEGSPQYQWMVEELEKGAADPSVRHMIASFHRPPYNTGHHSDDSQEVAAVFPALFSKYGVELVFAGHAHDYERSTADGVVYIVSGGGGAPNVWAIEDIRMNPDANEFSQVYLAIIHACEVTATPDCLLVKAIDTAGKVRDEVEIGACQWGRSVTAEPSPEQGARAQDLVSPGPDTVKCDCPPCEDCSTKNTSSGCASGNGSAPSRPWVLALMLLLFLGLRRQFGQVRFGRVPSGASAPRAMK